MGATKPHQLLEDAIELDVGLPRLELLDDVLEAVYELALRVLVRVVRDELDTRRVRKRRLRLFLFRESIIQLTKSREGVSEQPTGQVLLRTEPPHLVVVGWGDVDKHELHTHASKGVRLPPQGSHGRTTATNPPTVLAFPPSESCMSCVSLLFRYGMNFSFVDSAEMTSPSAVCAHHTHCQ